MANFETTLGGRDGTFPETAWSTVFSADAPPPQRRAALDRLFARYWRPVYAFIRSSWNQPIEEAKDLTQEFFGHLLESDFFAGYDRTRGRFRHFLKGALRNFLAEVHRNGSTRKRGGGKPDLPLDFREPGAGPFIEDPRQKSPEDIFDREWYRSLMEQCLAALERALSANGHPEVFRTYERYELRPPEGGAPSYDDVARELGLTVAQVAHHLENARKELREIVRAAISEYALTEEQVRQEILDLFQE